MNKKYLIAIDQSTQGTKGMLFDQNGAIILRCDRSHKQMIDERGWVEHDPMEILANTKAVVAELLQTSQIASGELAGVGISNQRETALAWNRQTGEPVYPAIVWQCARGEAICQELEQMGMAEMIQRSTGLPLSPYFSAAKIAWILREVPEARVKAEQGSLCCGTMDSFLLYHLTKEQVFKTDYSNASRTQLYDIEKLQWSEETAQAFGIPMSCLAEVCDSNSLFGTTDFDGLLSQPIPIHSVLGDSHGALFGQGCTQKGMAKSTYGTGSSVMMNIGERPVYSPHGVVTSLAWGMNGKVNYVLEGNINYTGAVISWLKDDLNLIESASETQRLAESANPADQTYLVPAFTGLGAPYWDSNARASITGITRTTGKAEVVRAALDSIAYQIADIVRIMSQDSGIAIEELRVDGGPTRNQYLMQFQSDLLNIPAQVPDVEELSGIGAAYAAGIALRIYPEDIASRLTRTQYTPQMSTEIRTQKIQGWTQAITQTLTQNS